MCSHRHVILHLPAKLRSNQMNDGAVMSYDVTAIFQDGGHSVRNLHPGLGLVTALKMEIYLHTRFG